MKKQVALKAARELSGKTQVQVAKEANLTERTYQRYEAGMSSQTIQTAIRIADALGVKDLRDLWGGNPSIAMIC